MQNGQIVCKRDYLKFSDKTQINVLFCLQDSSLLIHPLNISHLDNLTELTIIGARCIHASGPRLSMPSVRKLTLVLDDPKYDFFYDFRGKANAFDVQSYVRILFEYFPSLQDLTLVCYVHQPTVVESQLRAALENRLNRLCLQFSPYKFSLKVVLNSMFNKARFGNMMRFVLRSTMNRLTCW